MAWLNEEQSEVLFRFQLMQKGPHVILINYFTPGGRSKVGFSAIHKEEGSKVGFRAIDQEDGTR